MGELIERFPLFPLGLVLLPGETVPLHIFEERYKTMIGECVDHGREFGIVWLADSELKEIGCSAEVSEVLETAEDGRMNILVTGTTRFRLERRIDDMAYPAGDIELLPDEELLAGPDPDISAACRESYGNLVERVTGDRPDAAEIEQLSAYGMAATIAFEPAQKQELLDMRSEDDRLARLTRLCVKALERFEFSSEVSERAQTNGKVQR